MESGSITHEVTFNASPREVYEASIDPAIHSARARSRRPGRR